MQTYLDITEKQRRYEEPRVVRCMGPSKPLMVGPRGYGPGKAVLIIRPFRKKLDLGFIWVYEGSHTLNALDFERQRGEGRLKKEALSVDLDEYLILSSTLWAELPETSGDRHPIFVCKGYTHGIGRLLVDRKAPGYVSDDEVLPFMRVDRWNFGRTLPESS